MSQVYLTKIERKTIFTKSLIFVLIVFIISDLTITGPFYFNFIPWLFVLGFLGSIKSIDSILISIISGFTVFVSAIISDGKIGLNSIITTICALVLIWLGILTGKIIREFILEHRLVKYIKLSKKIRYICYIILAVVVSFVVVGVKDGNIITYLKSKSSLDEYIKNTYNITSYKIEKTNYNYDTLGKYTYVVNIDGEQVYFVPVNKDTFKDVNQEERLENINSKLAVSLNDKLEATINKYPLLNGVKVTVLMEYSKLDVLPNEKVMYIDYSNENINPDVYYELSVLIKEIYYNVEGITKISLTVNNQDLQIEAKNVSNLTKDYLMGGFNIEQLDN